MTDNKTLGNLGEKITKEYLLKKGYAFLNQNYTVSKLELDLIFSFEQKIIFVEVKTRIENDESVTENPLTKWQTKNLERAMIKYCFQNHINLDSAQLDLVIVLISKEKRLASLKHYPNIL